MPSIVLTQQSRLPLSSILKGKITGYSPQHEAVPGTDAQGGKTYKACLIFGKFKLSVRSSFFGFTKIVFFGFRSFGLNHSLAKICFESETICDIFSHCAVAHRPL